VRFGLRQRLYVICGLEVECAARHGICHPASRGADFLQTWRPLSTCNTGDPHVGVYVTAGSLLLASFNAGVNLNGLESLYVSRPPLKAFVKRNGGWRATYVQRAGSILTNRGDALLRHSFLMSALMRERRVAPRRDCPFSLSISQVVDLFGAFVLALVRRAV
jgi:hypothetical protein